MENVVFCTYGLKIADLGLDAKSLNGRGYNSGKKTQRSSRNGGHGEKEQEEKKRAGKVAPQDFGDTVFGVLTCGSCDSGGLFACR